METKGYAIDLTSQIASCSYYYVDCLDEGLFLYSSEKTFTISTLNLQEVLR
jgi:hypothetical protein